MAELREMGGILFKKTDNFLQVQGSKFRVQGKGERGKGKGIPVGANNYSPLETTKRSFSSSHHREDKQSPYP